MCVSVKDALHKLLNEKDSNIVFVCNLCQDKKKVNKLVTECEEKTSESENEDKISRLKEQIDELQRQIQEKTRKIDDFQRTNEKLKSEVTQLAGKNVPNEKENNLQKEKFELEISYLKNLVSEVQDKNLILKENNSLLLERINRMEGNNKQKYPNPPRTIGNNGRNYSFQRARNTSSGDVHAPITYKDAIEKDKHGENITGQVQSMKSSLTDTTRQNSSNVRDEKDNTVVSFDRRNQNKNNEDKRFSGNEGENDFQVPRSRGTWRNTKKLGTSDASVNGFEGGDRRAWLHIYRVKRTADEKIIADYIKRKPGFENEIVTVKELPTENNRLKSFVVIAPLNKKEELYETAFWPKMVGIQRFDFRRHREFLSQAGSFFLD